MTPSRDQALLNGAHMIHDKGDDYDLEQRCTICSVALSPPCSYGYCVDCISSYSEGNDEQEILPGADDCGEEEQKCTICLQDVENAFTLLCYLSYCVQCISTWLEGPSKTCPLCCRKVLYPTVIDIDSQKSALRAHLPTGWDELDDMLDEMTGLREQIFWMKLWYTIMRDEETVLRGVAHSRKLDEMILSSFQRRLEILRGTAPSFGRNLQIWQQKEECRRVVGVDPDNARAIARGFRGVEGFDLPEPWVRMVKSAGYWLFHIFLTIIAPLNVVGWIKYLERATRPDETEWPPYSGTETAKTEGLNGEEAFTTSNRVASTYSLGTRIL